MRIDFCVQSINVNHFRKQANLYIKMEKACSTSDRQTPEHLLYSMRACVRTHDMHVSVESSMTMLRLS